MGMGMGKEMGLAGGRGVEWSRSSQNLWVGVSRSEGTVTICASGELDAHSAPVLARYLYRAVERPGRVVLDLSRVTFCGAAGVDLLLKARRRAAGAGGAVVVGRAHSAVVRLLEACREPEAWLIAEEVRAMPLSPHEQRPRLSVLAQALMVAFEITGAPRAPAEDLPTSRASAATSPPPSPPSPPWAGKAATTASWPTSTSPTATSTAPSPPSKPPAPKPKSTTPGASGPSPRPSSPWSPPSPTRYAPTTNSPSPTSSSTPSTSAPPSCTRASPPSYATPAPTATSPTAPPCCAPRPPPAACPGSSRCLRPPSPSTTPYATPTTI
ncbi:STAS domain-containing protein [Streptomyces rimosus]|uniref:STAS domain-containing protein n=1 Tax=Streptomyces rimosus TaxID=1927 RepID=UPI000997FEF7